MTYKSFQPKKDKKITKKIAIFSAIFLLALFTFFPSVFKGFSSFANEISIPFWKAGEGTTSGFSRFSSLFASKQTLYDENLILKDKVKTLEEKLSGYNFAVQENIELKKAFLGDPKGRIFAQIVSRPNVAAYDTFIIDKGEKDGIVKGAKVLSGDMSLMGTVEEVYPNTSKARLFSTAGTITNVFLGPENIPAEIHGTGGGTYTALVPDGVDIREGDTALLSSDPSRIVAFVVSKEKADDDSFQKFYLKNPADLFSIKYVEIER